METTVENIQFKETKMNDIKFILNQTKAFRGVPSSIGHYHISMQGSSWSFIIKIILKIQFMFRSESDPKLDQALAEVNKHARNLHETEKVAVRKILIEERSR